MVMIPVEAHFASLLARHAPMRVLWSPTRMAMLSDKPSGGKLDKMRGRYWRAAFLKKACKTQSLSMASPYRQRHSPCKISRGDSPGKVSTVKLMPCIGEKIRSGREISPKFISASFSSSQGPILATNSANSRRFAEAGIEIAATPPNRRETRKLRPFLYRLNWAGHLRPSGRVMTKVSLPCMATSQICPLIS